MTYPSRSVASVTIARGVARWSVRLLASVRPALLAIVAQAALVQGVAFAEVCERMLACDPVANGAQRAFELLAQWLDDGLLVGVS